MYHKKHPMTFISLVMFCACNIIFNSTLVLHIVSSLVIIDFSFVEKVSQMFLTYKILYKTHFFKKSWLDIFYAISFEYQKTFRHPTFQIQQQSNQHTNHQEHRNSKPTCVIQKVVRIVSNWPKGLQSLWHVQDWVYWFKIGQTWLRHAAGGQLIKTDGNWFWLDLTWCRMIRTGWQPACVG